MKSKLQGTPVETVGMVVVPTNGVAFDFSSSIVGEVALLALQIAVDMEVGIFPVIINYFTGLQCFKSFISC